MVNFKRLADRAKDVVDAQGGPEALKEKAKRVKDVATGPGTVSERARAAAEVARETPAPTAGESGEETGRGPAGGTDDPPAGGSR